MVFNENIMKEEPDKIQCLFVIGYLFWKKIGNLPIALDKFEDFLVEAKDNSDYLTLYNITKNNSLISGFDSIYYGYLFKGRITNEKKQNSKIAEIK